MLPKLAECPKYRSNPISSPAASRGSQLDALYRGAIPESDAFTSEEIASIRWARRMTELHAGGDDIIYDEKDLKVQVLGMDGTADACVPLSNLSFDLKTGQVHNYREQQAAYALGFMYRYFTSSWRVILLFSDQRHVEELFFTEESAIQILRDVMSKAVDEMAVATPCDYCNWCKNKFTCEQRLEKVAWWYKQSGDAIDWEKELDDPDKLAQFLDLCSIISRDGGLHDLAKEKAKAILSGGGKLTGFGLRSRKGTEFIEPKDIAQHVDALGIDAILAAYGNMRAEKFRGLWEAKLGSEPVPTSIIQSGPGSSYVSATKKTTKPQPNN